MRYYEVAPTIIIRMSSSTFTYASLEQCPLGSFVTIPVGKKTVTGVIISETTKPSYATKQFDSLLDIPPLPPALISVSLWMSEYYATHLAIVLQTVLPRGITKKRRTSAISQSINRRERTTIVFNKSQQNAIKTIDKMAPGTAILHGITGSGKTAVYIELVRQSIESGKSAIILVPEIALTSQLVADVSQYFPDVIVTHSKLTEAARHTLWLRIANSKTPLVIVGPRSALFMPVPSLGLIVIDEAHEPSFKQDQSPRYAAQRVASVLAQLHKAKVIQGSATPLISEYYLATKHDRPIIEMNEKARKDTTAPTVIVTDMTKRSHFTKHRLFSNELLADIETTLTSSKQLLIFHNRRGSASTTLCESCGWSAICPRCFVHFTLHADKHRLECHICGLSERVPTSCPECHDTNIRHKGVGTKLIEAELAKLFPKAVIARFDGDAANDATVEQRYQDLYDGKIQIIIGTQVVAKGLDLPHLAMVGVIQADAGLALPDFAASERTFQLLAQVVGRVGRSSEVTRIVVQSYQPQAPAVQLGLTQNYSEFYALTLAERQRANFPPFTYLLKLTCVYKTEAAAIKNASALADTLRQHYPNVQILGPTPAFYERQHDTYRWQLVIKSPRRAKLIEILQHVPPANWQADLDPATLL